MIAGRQRLLRFAETTPAPVESFFEHNQSKHALVTCAFRFSSRASSGNPEMCFDIVALPFDCGSSEPAVRVSETTASVAAGNAVTSTYAAGIGVGCTRSVRPDGKTAFHAMRGRP